MPPLGPDPADRRRPSLRTRLVVLGVMVATSAAVAADDVVSSRLSSLLSDSLILGAAIIGGWWCRAGRDAAGAPSRSWRQLGLGLWCWAAGQFLWILLADVGGDPPAVSWADAGFLGGLAVMGHALASMLRTRSAAWVRLRLLTEGAIVATSLVAVLWPSLLRHLLDESELNLEWWVSISYPMADLSLLTIAIMLIPRRIERAVELTPLIIGLTCLAAADLLFLYGWYHDGITGGQLFSLGFVAGPLAIGLNGGLVAFGSWGRPVQSTIAGAFPQFAAASVGVMLATQAVVGTSPDQVQMVLAGIVMALVGLDQFAVLRENRELADDLEAVVDERTEAWREAAAEVASRNERLAHQATHDALTGLPNRRALFDRLSPLPSIDGSQWWLLLVDLDNFKVVNDGGGHAVGDQVLRHAAERLQGIPGADHVIRLGGDEFAILTRHPTERGAPTDVAAEVLGVLSEPFAIDGFTWTVGGSVGLAVLTDGVPIESALRDADLAMYAAKAAGRGRWEVHTDEMAQRNERSQRLMAELREALDQHQFVLHFQPIVVVADSSVVGAEALVRWQHPERGLLYPGDFIDVAETTGAIVPLGLEVLDQALAALRAWIDQGLVDPAAFTMSVNLSTRQLEQAGFVEELAMRLALHDIDPSALQLEVTETSLLSGDEAVMSRLVGIHELGVRLAVDDFGTGYAGFEYLQRGLFDVVKLDRSLVMVDGGQCDWPVAEAVLGLAGRLNFEVVAEGVEVPQQLSILRELGCAKAQGYLFDRPMPADRFVESLQAGWVRS